MKDVSSNKYIAVYSFVGIISSILCYLGFLIWAFSSDDFLHSLGITYFPDRYYAVALPVYFLCTYFLVSVIAMGYNMMNTHDPELMVTISDEQSIYFNRGNSLANANNGFPSFIVCSPSDGIPNIGDIHPMHISLATLRHSNGLNVGGPSISSEYT